MLIVLQKGLVISKAEVNRSEIELNSEEHATQFLLIKFEAMNKVFFFAVVNIARGFERYFNLI